MAIKWYLQITIGNNLCSNFLMIKLVYTSPKIELFIARHQYHNPQPYQFAQSTSASVPNPECTCDTHTTREGTLHDQKATEGLKSHSTFANQYTHNHHRRQQYSGISTVNCLQQELRYSYIGSKLSLLTKLHTHRPNNP